MKKQRKKKTTKVDWRRLMKKAAEESVKKTIETVILAIILGASIKFLWVVPAATTGVVTAKIVKIVLIDKQ